MNSERFSAAVCLDLSRQFVEFSPAARDFMAVFGQRKASPSGVLRRFNKWLFRMLIIRRLEILVLNPDASVRVMSLLAMKNMQHVSKNIGLIATLCNSEDSGDLFSKKGELIGNVSLSEQVYLYLHEVLDLRELDCFEILAGKFRHWQGCLATDYSEEFRTEKRPLKVNGEVISEEYQLSDEELSAKLTASKRRTLNLAQQDLRECWQKYFETDFIQRRSKAVYNGLDNIFQYLFVREENKEKIGNVLQLLDKFADRGQFPQFWLVTLAKKNLNLN